MFGERSSSQASTGGQATEQLSTDAAAMVVEAEVRLGEFGLCLVRIEPDGDGVLVSEPRSECHGTGVTFESSLLDLVTVMIEYRDFLRGEVKLSPAIQRQLDFLEGLARPSRSSVTTGTHGVRDIHARTETGVSLALAA